MKRPSSKYIRMLSFLRDEKGAIATVVAIVLPLLLALAGLGVDTSMWIMTNRKLQVAVDAAVISGAWEVANDRKDNMQTAALREAQNNG